MTERERVVMAFMVPDPDAWLAHAVATFGEEKAAEFLAAKVARWSDAYDAAQAKPEYKTRSERDADDAAAVAAEAAKHEEAMALDEQKKQTEFNAAVDARVRAILEEMKIG